ncbi:MAG: DUF1656 domain-containing protein, partial [Janthinobacterium lividum]
MWRETNLFGILFSPLLVYLGVAALLYMPLRWLLLRLRLFRWMWNPPLAGTAIYICI